MKIAYLVILFLTPFLCFSQFKGIVKDSKIPVAFANVFLSTSEGKFITGAITNEDGSFEINLKRGNYQLKISAVGYNDYHKDILFEESLNIGEIQLLGTTTNLNEVVIKSKKKIIEQKIDRLVYNLESNIAISGGDALNALGTAPGVIVKNNSISILGKGLSKIMIDGRILELSGEELNSFLKSIAASDIKNIEIITNPSAKYDANGDGGLINLNLKKGVKNSWKNTTTLNYEQNKYAISTLRDNFIYSKNKIRFSLSGNGKKGNSKEKETLNIYYPNGLWDLNNISKIKEDNISGRIALDYDITEKTTIGFQYLGDRSNPDRNSNTSINIYNSSNSLESVLINNGLNNQQSTNNSLNGHLLTKLDSLNRKLTLDIDYFNFHSKSDNNFIAKTFLPNMTFVNINQSAKNTSNQNVENISIKADIEHPLKSFNLSYGFKASFVNSNSDVNYFNTITGNPELDPNQSNLFNYKENNQAIYVSGDKKINDKLNIQLGLRLEITQTTGFSTTLKQQSDYDYLKLFPTFYIAYKKNENHNFNFNYGKRINRPGFSLLNPFRSYINSNSYSEGNPFLKPSFSDNFDFTHSYKDKFRTNAFLNFTSEGYGVLFTSNPVTNTQIITRENYYKEYYYGIGENYESKINKWWECQSSLYFLGSQTDFTSTINAKPSNNIQLYFSINNTFSINETTKLQVDYFYSSPFKKGLYEIGYMAGLNIALQKSMYKKRLQLSILLNDIFNTSYLKDYKSIVNNINQVYSENNSSRFIRIGLTYNFGNKKINLEQHDSGNEEEKNRTTKK